MVQSELIILEYLILIPPNPCKDNCRIVFEYEVINFPTTNRLIALSKWVNLVGGEGIAFNELNNRNLEYGNILSGAGGALNIGNHLHSASSIGKIEYIKQNTQVEFFFNSTLIWSINTSTTKELLIDWVIGSYFANWSFDVINNNAAAGRVNWILYNLTINFI